jgi:hypothetical protein
MVRKKQNFSQFSIQLKTKTVLCALLLLNACQSRKSLTNSVDDTPGLDLLDTAILYPPAGGTDELIWNRSLFANQDTWDSQEAHLNALSDMGFWPQLFGRSALMPQKVFDEIILQASGDRTNKTPGAGINFELSAYSTRATDNKFDVKIDVSSAARWRVTSFRYDPCPYSVAHGLPASEEDADENQSNTFPATLKTQLCKPEFRLVAQPFIGKTPQETAVGGILPFIRGPAGTRLDAVTHKSSGWFAADYAMHLFYRLDAEQSFSVAQALLQLKEQFQNTCKTTGVPLQVHPCLIQEALKPNQYFKNTFAKSLLEIYSKYSQNLHKVAIFGSEANASPWMFFVGNVTKPSAKSKAEPSFALSRIKSLDDFDFSSKRDILSESKSKLDAEEIRNAGLRSVVIREFNEEESQLKAEKLSKRSIFTQRKGVIFNRNTALGLRRVRDSYNRRILPPPHPSKDSLAMFVMGTVGFQTQDEFSLISASGYNLGLTNIKPSGNRSEDLIKVISRIENPRINNEFRTDCVSCHMANMEGASAHMTDRTDKVFKELQLKKLDDPSTPWKFSENLIPKTSFESEQGLATFRLAPYALSHRGTREMVYMMNQFSIYRDQPIISKRVLNEASEATSFANKYVLKKTNPWNLTCDMRALEMCTSIAGGLLDRNRVNLALTENFDWYAAFLNNQECIRPERQICKPK